MAFPRRSPHYSVRFIAGGLSEIFTVSFTHPADVLKVRLQLTGEGVAGSDRVSIRDLTRIGHRLALVDGVQNGLYAGISAAWLRQAVFGTLRHGLYGVLEEHQRQSFETITLTTRLGCAVLSGGLAAIVANPVDVVLIRMQADGHWPAEQRRNYRNVFDGLLTICRTEGGLVLYRGYCPTVFRAILITTSQIPTYEEAKAAALRHGFQEGVRLHLCCAMLSATAACLVTHPVDVVKTRIMNMHRGSGSAYGGPLDVVWKTGLIEGPLAFYKGLSATCLRLWPHTVILWLSQERILSYLRR